MNQKRKRNSGKEQSKKSIVLFKPSKMNPWDFGHTTVHEVNESTLNE